MFKDKIGKICIKKAKKKKDVKILYLEQQGLIDQR